ncbi:hypothetical protein, partial [Aquimarina agarilytica]|uniref:hypothetical protein n=1 Tax=Aquimarina agarilytica TaxID=1087449 RepID=UPI0012FCCC6D
MKKNILFGFSFMLLLLGLASCEKEFSTQDCEAINSMEINTTKVKDEGDEAIYYAFTPNNAKFLTYDYQWYVDDELQPAATKSLFQYKFTKNGTYTICFEPILKSGDNCELTKTCTSVAVDSLKDTAVKDPCDEIEFSQVVALNGNSSKFATVALQAKGDFQGARTYKWYLNGKELSDDDRKAILDTNVTSSLTVFKFEEAGTYNIKLMVSSKECKGKSLSVEAEVDADLNVKIMDQKEAVEEGAPT